MVKGGVVFKENGYEVRASPLVFVVHICSDLLIQNLVCSLQLRRPNFLA